MDGRRNEFEECRSPVKIIDRVLMSHLPGPASHGSCGLLFLRIAPLRIRRSSFRWRDLTSSLLASFDRNALAPSPLLASFDRNALAPSPSLASFDRNALAPSPSLASFDRNARAPSPGLAPFDRNARSPSPALHSSDRNARGPSPVLDSLDRNALASEATTTGTRARGEMEPSGDRSKRPRVVVVGAGMAGIAAAHRLQQQAGSRVELTILEAGDRIGGRAFSASFDAERIELGATWIHGIDGSPIFEIAQRIGAMKSREGHWELEDGPAHHVQVRAEGGVVVKSELAEPISRLYKRLAREVKDSTAAAECEERERSGDGETFGAFLRRGFDRFVAPEGGTGRAKPSGGGGSTWDERSLQEGVFRAFENHERVITAADDLADVDLEELKGYRELPGEHRTIGEGYASVLRELARRFPDGTIRLGQKVEGISWSDAVPSGSPVLVRCAGGSVVEADHVIVTCSLGVLKERALPTSFSSLDSSRLPSTNSSPAPETPRAPGGEASSPGIFNPPLPKWKLDSISRLGFGSVNKLFLQFDPPSNGDTHKHLQLVFHPEPPAQGSDGVPAWIRKCSFIYPIHEKSHLLLVWVVGSEALQTETLSDEEVVKGVSNTMARFGVEVGTYRGMIRSRWGRDPLFMGSYSYLKVGSTGDDIDRLAEPLPKLSDDRRRAEAEHPLQILFAGEATDRHYYSTTHGAYFSGVREADRLLEHYGFTE